jgi:hypothetical protein
MKLAAIPFAIGLVASSSVFGQARVIITEIMYNPNSEEKAGQTEWIEIANVGTEPAEIKDWRLDDEDKKNWGKFSCTLAPGAIAVLINADAVKEEQFRAAWDDASASGGAGTGAYQVIAVKWGGISNKPGVEDEIIQLRNDKDEVVCEVKQQGEWPSCKRPDGPSIWLSDLKAADLCNGKIWTRSEASKDGARNNKKTDIFNGVDIGSPGYVHGLSTAVATAPPSAAPKPDEKPSSADGIDY